MAYDRSKDPSAGEDVAAPASRAAAVTPSDTADLTLYAKALYVGVTGDVKVIPAGAADDTAVTFTAHPVGYLPCRVRRVLSTGTTATNILALYD